MSRGFADIQNAIIGSPKFLGVIDGTTTAKTNAEATTPFSASGLTGKTLLIHASAACFIGMVDTSTGDVTTANGVPLAADEKAIITVHPSYPFLAVIHATATVSLKVWELLS